MWFENHVDTLQSLEISCPQTATAAAGKEGEEERGQSADKREVEPERRRKQEQLIAGCNAHLKCSLLIRKVEYFT